MESNTTKIVRVAAYDFDGTVIDCSSPTQLVNRLIRQHRISPLTSLKIGFWGLAYKWRLPQNESWVRGQVFKAFEGKPHEQVDRYLADFYDTVISPHFRDAADADMRKRFEEGCFIIVVSASFEPIVLRAMESRPFQAQISTKMKIAKDGTYTREVDGKPIEGVEKLVVLKRWCDREFGEGCWELEYAYGNHHSDKVLLEAAVHPFAVDPNSGLTRIARERSWPILDW